MKNLFFVYILLLLSANTIAQDLDVAGIVKVNAMTLDNEVDSVVVRMSDGTLGLRDVSSLSQFSVKPILVGSLFFGDFPKAVRVSGQYAYVINYGSQDLKIVDVTDPSSPAIVGSLGLGPQPWDLYVSGRYAYVVDDLSDDLKIIDVSDPSSPSLRGSLGLGNAPNSVVVSGRYAYVVDRASDDLKIIDVSDPSLPILTGSLSIGAQPNSLYVSGRYAYVVDITSEDLKIIDVSDPSSPSLAGSLGIGTFPNSVYVSGRYAFVVDQDSDDLKVIDISDPSSPMITGSLGIGSVPKAVFVSGSYSFVVDSDSNDLKIIDISDPSSPMITGSIGIGTNPNTVYVSGRHAFVLDITSRDLKIIDISGGEYTSLIAHSMEVGNLQLKNDLVAQGQVQITGALNVGSGGIYSDGDVGITGSLNVLDSVGIGNNSPQEVLHVTGKLRVDGTQLFLKDGNQNISLNTNPGSGYVQLDVGGTGHSTDHIILGQAGAQNNNIGIGTITPNDALDVVGDIDATGCIQTDDTGTIGGTCLSDQRLKKNIRPLESQLNKLLALRPVTYDWKDAPLHNSHPSEIGLVAQEVEAFIPEMVINSEDDYKRIRYDISLQLRMIKAMQEQQVIIEKQRVQLEEQHKQIENQKALNAKFENMLLNQNKQLQQLNNQLLLTISTHTISGQN